MKTLTELYQDQTQIQRPLGDEPAALQFLRDLEKSISQDLWKSWGGHWSESSVEVFRKTAIEKWVMQLQLKSKSSPSSQTTVLVPENLFLMVWTEVVRDFHQDAQAHSSSRTIWGEQALAKKEKKPLTEEQKSHRKLFMYIWAMMQTAIVTKTAIFYFGLKSAEEGTTEGKVYVTLAILTTLFSLSFFAIRNYKDK